MAAFELNIKATSLADLELAIRDLHARFPGLEATGATGPLKEAASAQAASAGEGGPEAAGRRPGRPRRVAAAAHPPAAGEAQALPAPADAGSLDDAAGGDAGAVGSEASAEAEGDGAVEDGPAADHDGRAEAGAETAVGAPETGEAAGGGEAAAGAAPLEAAERPAAEHGAGAPTLEDLKAATKQLIATKGIAAAQKIYSELGIPKPGQTPDEKIPGALAAVNAALNQA